MSFESFPNMNTNKNEGVSHSTPAQMAKAEFLLRGSSLSLEGDTPEKKAGSVEHRGSFELNAHLIAEKREAERQKGVAPKFDIDNSGRFIVGEEEAQKAAVIFEEAHLNTAIANLKKLNSPQAQKVLEMLESENPEVVKAGVGMLKKYGFNEGGPTLN